MRGIVLCGGQSRRMGQKKQWLPFGGHPLLWHTLETMYAVCEDVIVVANEEDELQRLQAFGLATVSDEFPGQGPLAGLHAGLRGVAAQEIACLVGCDLPFLRAEILQEMRNLMERDPHVQAVVPQDGQHLYPVCALYRGQVHDVAASCLEKGQNALRHFLATLHVQHVPVERWGHLMPPPFLNMNTPDDYRMACNLWRERFEQDE